MDGLADVAVSEQRRAFQPINFDSNVIFVSGKAKTRAKHCDNGTAISGQDAGLDAGDGKGK